MNKFEIITGLNNTNLTFPKEKKRLYFTYNKLISTSRKKHVNRIKNQIYFLNKNQIKEISGKRDFLDNIKTRIKSLFGKNYKILIWIISIHMPRMHWKTMQTYLSYVVNKEMIRRKVVLNVGSGNDRFNEKIINVDIYPFSEVDIIADAINLPFKNNSVDGIVNTMVLEHVTDPENVLKEAYRVLKKGGVIITAAPFLENFHSSPHDYYRWSYSGLEFIHNKFGFKTKEIIPLAGPTAALLIVLQEWLSLLLSFNITFLYYFWFFVFTVILVPIKILDLLLINYKMSYKISASNLYIGKK